MISEEKTYNSIILQKSRIEEIEKIKQLVASSETKDIRINIETKHWYGYFDPFMKKEKHKTKLTKDTTILILEGLQDKCKERIDKLIDMEIERRKNEQS